MTFMVISYDYRVLGYDPIVHIRAHFDGYRVTMTTGSRITPES